MFKDAYRNDNERIKPDDEFLEQLKKTLAQEKIVHMADLTNNKSVAYVGDKERVQVKNPFIARKVIWKYVIGIAACLVIACTAVYAVNRGGLLQDYKMMTRLQDALFDEATEDEMAEDKKELDLETKQMYDMIYSLFQTYNVVIYNVETLATSDVTTEYLDELRNSQYEVSAEERDGLVADILNQKYEFVESMETFKNSQYYVAEFENDSFAVFVVESDKYIYIQEVSDVPVLTYRESGR